VQFASPRTTESVTLSGGLEVRAGAVPFRTELALDLLPVESRVFVKRTLPPQPQRLLDYHRALYASYQGEGLPPSRL
jgi:hypothetical protein